MEGGAEHAVSQFYFRKFVRTDCLQAAGSGFWQQCVARDDDVGYYRRRTCWLAPLDDRLSKNRKADEAENHHQSGERNLGSQGHAAWCELPHRHHVRQIDGDHVPDKDRNDCGVPREASTNDGGVDPVSSGSEKIPSPPERIG